jgi:hypothetical protein
MGFLLNFFKPSPVEKKRVNREKRGESAVGHESGVANAPNVRQTPEKADIEKQIILDIAILLPQVPRQYIHPDLPGDLKKEVRFSLHELLPSLAQGKATVPFVRIAGLSPEIFTDQRPAEQLEIKLPLAQVIAQAGKLPSRADQLNEKPASTGEKFSKLVLEKSGSAQIPVVQASPTTEVKEEAHGTPETKAEVKTPQPSSPPVDDEKILLRLSALLPHIPKGLLQADSKPVEKAVRVPLPFHLIESQLGTGKVELSLPDFLRALPDEFKTLFVSTTNGDSKTKIPIPLAEVLLNLPGTTPLPLFESTTAINAESAAKAEKPVTGSVADQPASAEITATVESAPEPAKSAEDITAVVTVKKTETGAQQAVIEIAASEVVFETPPVVASPETEPTPAPTLPEPVLPVAEVPAIKVEIPQPVAKEKTAAPESSPAPSEAETFIIESPPQAAYTNLATILPPALQLRTLTPPSVVATHQEPSPQSSDPIIQPPQDAPAPAAPENPFFSNGKLDPVKVAEHIAKFDNITAVALNIAEEFQTAGAVPRNLHAQDICTAARNLFQSIESAGVADRTPHLTLQHDTFSSTFFKRGDILLGVVHPHNPLPWETHGKLAALTEEVARLR